MARADEGRYQDAMLQKAREHFISKHRATLVAYKEVAAQNRPLGCTLNACQFSQQKEAIWDKAWEEMLESASADDFQTSKAIFLQGKEKLSKEVYCKICRVGFMSAMQLCEAVMKEKSKTVIYAPVPELSAAL